ncbi:serine hydrolase domain-containing protein [Acidicapsa dinghuensis]|uniref:Serine hydrolase domain-containing protein n=1 Tax=Acidicapsa dinghuensis TaxID=2218256 RepID=A0ABW1EKI9_9BACT|nr:serine hydrolase domain-containing protein [Acidicapsa dinghuensis]
MLRSSSRFALTILLSVFFSEITGAPALAQTHTPANPAQPAAPLKTTPATPAATPGPGPAAPPPGSHALTSADLEAFFDGVVPLQLERSDVVGASVLVMKDGQTLLEKGYGYADLKNKKTVDPNSTIFRLASISKLFTWVSVMQLVEQGKLNLDTDVNQYLDFQIRPAFNKPVTLRNLMTHTGGFEETADDIILLNPKDAVSLRDYLIHNQPMRLFPPGEVPAYSNYGVGLASYIVQRASGQPFEQYVQQHIFTPLGMTHSSFEQPLPKSLANLPSEGYRDDTTKPAVGFEIFNPVGAGGISSSAADMGRFGQALLNGGSLDGKQILKPETLALMWTPQFQASPQLPPICMGFYQDWRNNLRWIGHEGDLIAFHSLFFVEPSQKLVLFVSYNSAGGGGRPRPEIIDMFTDRYFPGAPKVEFLKTLPPEMKAIEGRYQTTRRSDSTKMALGNLFSQRSLSINKDGVLRVSGFRDLREHVVKWKAIGKDLWQAEDDQTRIFAIRDSSNRVVRLAVDFPGVQIQRVRWFENSRLVLPITYASIGVLALVVIASIIRLGRRLFLHKRPRWKPQPGTIWLTASPRIAAWLWILFLAAIVGYFAATSDDISIPNPHWYPWFVLVNWVVAVILVFSFFTLIRAFFIWTRADLRLITKLKFTIVALSCVVLGWVAIHWNVIGSAHRI